MKLLGVYTDNSDVEIILSVLRAREIKYVRKNNVGSMLGIPIGLIGEQEIFVNENDYEPALEIVKEFFNDGVDGGS